VSYVDTSLPPGSQRTSLGIRVRLALRAAVDSGMSTSQAARACGVGRSPVKRSVAQRRRTGSVVPHPYPGRTPVIPSEHHPALLTLVDAHPVATRAGYCRCWEASGDTRVSVSTMSHTLQRLGFTRRGSGAGGPR